MRFQKLEDKVDSYRGSINSLWDTLSRDRKYLKSEIDNEHNRISVLAPQVEQLKKYQQDRYLELSSQIDRQEELIQNLLRIIKVSGIVEVAETGENLFQFHSTVDILQRNPLYKINKVVTKEKK